MYREHLYNSFLTFFIFFYLLLLGLGEIMPGLIKKSGHLPILECTTL